MPYINRNIQQSIITALKRNKSILLFGARQTGKTTLVQQLTADLSISLVQPAVRLHYETNVSALTIEIEALAEKCKHRPLIIIDEMQKVPAILDAVQDLIDRKIAKFVLTGSSARKLKTAKRLNLLPGRVVVFQLDPLNLTELVGKKVSLNDLLLYGSLPGIVTLTTRKNKELDLRSYVITYLEEEVRTEAMVRNVGSFARFLTLAASESGNIISFRKLSQEIGIAHTTIADYYQILEDCLIAERIDPLIKTKVRRRLIKSSKYILYDLGLRRIAAGEGRELPLKYMGTLFEQFIGLELLRCSHTLAEAVKVYFWRDKSGIEVDWIIEKRNKYIPIEVKWTTRPTINDAKYIQLFLDEYENSSKGYIVCQIPRPMKLTANIYAIPWQDIDQLV